MKLRLLQDTDWKHSAVGVALMGAAAAILFMVQVVLAGFANIELVSLLMMLFTISFKRRVLYVIYAFVLLEGLLYGFHLWWISYLYVWTVLACVTWLFRAVRSAVFMAVVSGLFGLSFGALCAIPYLFISGFEAAAAYWISGIPFDLVHCAGNFLLCLILWSPLYKVFEKIGLIE